MAVNLRKKYSGKKEVSKKNRPYRYQLDYYYSSKRVRETIKDVEFLPTDTKEQRSQKTRIINKIKADLEIELANQSNGLISRQLKKASFIKYFETLANKKNPNTKVTWNNTLRHIILFHGKRLRFEDVTENWINRFSDYLVDNLSKITAKTYLDKVNAILNHAVKHKIILDNPFKYVDKFKVEETEMIFLSKDEVQEIIDTDFYNKEIKNTFLFGCYTGLRFSDLIKLKWNNIEDKSLHISQTKTKNTLYIPLSKNAEHILNLQRDNEEFIFNITSNASSNKILKKLIKQTSINKKVSFHSARHTFATLLITSGVNIFTVSKLLGHKDIKSTLVYAKVINEEKEKAINSLPNFNF